ncbi:MAG: cysteine desulfurase [Clostridia bacterium]|nr:cysteine desulfurase [Clostridia bacterium]
MQRIYLDNASTTNVSSEVLNEMLSVFSQNFGNSNSLHSFGRDAQALVDTARDRIAKAINAERGEIYFTSGGTESNNWAILGLALANKNKGNRVITSQIEHASVLESCKKLETLGFEVVYLPVDSTGLVSIVDLIDKLDQNTILVSIMSVNNEVGTIQNIKTIAKIVHEKDIIFHTDAVQAVGNFAIDVKDLEVDVMSVSGHKIHAPKGIGALYVKKGIKIDNLIVGGEQERGKRGGTLNVPSIVGFGKAFEILTKNYVYDCKKVKTLRDYFFNRVMNEIDDVELNGHQNQKLAGLVNLSFAGVDGEALLFLLDLEGIAVSTGSACSSGSQEPSHVLMAMKVQAQVAKGAIRFSFSKSNTKEEVDYVVEKLKASVAKLREFSTVRVKKTTGEKNV